MMIPKKFHFVFGLARQTAPLHLIHYLCLASCLAVNSPDAIYFYYHHEPHGRYWDLIKKQLILVKIPSVPLIEHYRYPDHRVARYRYAHASDFVRLEKLLSHGGVYADMDTLFVNPIPDALYAKSFVLGREDDIIDQRTKKSHPSVCNAFIMAERGAPFGKLWLSHMENAFDGTWSNHSTLLPHELATQHPDLIHLEPARTFYKHMWTRQGLHTLLEGLDTDNTGVVSFHLWSHLWWSRWRRDFSNFNAAKMTPAFIQNVDTTYNVIARQYLPPPETTTQWVNRQTTSVNRIAQAVTETAREAYMKTYILAKLVAFSVIRENMVPRAAEHLDYAQRQWKHPYVRTHFRARNPFEQEVVLNSVALWDEYHIESLRFTPDDIILDIGAHVGIFSYLCYRRGARRIYAYEPEIQNFQRLAQHLGKLEGIQLFNLAVFRSDQTRVSLTHSGYAGDNTGGGNVLFQGQVVEIQEQTLSPVTPARQTIETVPLDEILESLPPIRLLKIDCEGSEFPILLTSRLLERIDEIIGEYHEISPELYARLTPSARLSGLDEFRLEALVAYLEAQGFCVYTESRAPHLGYFRATRVAKSQNA